MTTNERFSSKSRADSSASMNRPMLNQRPSNLSFDDQTDDTLLRSTFMGPSNGSCCGNWIRMCTYGPPSQQIMKDELLN